MMFGGIRVECLCVGHTGWDTHCEQPLLTRQWTRHVRNLLCYILVVTCVGDGRAGTWVVIRSWGGDDTGAAAQRL